jgi:hypothetical protein
MQLSDHPDKVVKHRPKRCGGCGKPLRRGEGTGVERRQVTGIPPVKAEVSSNPQRRDGPATHLSPTPTRPPFPVLSCAVLTVTWSERASAVLLRPPREATFAISRQTAGKGHRSQAAEL